MLPELMQPTLSNFLLLSGLLLVIIYGVAAVFAKRRRKRQAEAAKARVDSAIDQRDRADLGRRLRQVEAPHRLDRPGANRNSRDVRDARLAPDERFGRSARDRGASGDSRHAGSSSNDNLTTFMAASYISGAFDSSPTRTGEDSYTRAESCSRDSGYSSDTGSYSSSSDSGGGGSWD